MIRYVKVIIVITMGLFFAMIALNNLTDLETNLTYTHGIISMSWINNAKVHWRAIENPIWSHIAYGAIVFWQIITSLYCWIGAAVMLKHIHKDTQKFAQAKRFALIGLTMGFTFFMIGFVVIASEWFYMFETELNNVVVKALLLASLIISCMAFIFSSTNENAITLNH